jgi:hypothetical protein
MSTHRLVGIYLNNHLTLANAGVDLFKRVAASKRDSDLGPELEELAGQVEEDRDTLRKLMRRLDVAERLPMTLVGKVGERLGRLKPNGYLVRRSPLADVVELEGLRDSVAVKIAAWQVLRAVATHDKRVTREETEALLERAEDQASRLYRMHLRVTEALLSDGELRT